jgi:hypothetical protein
MADATEHAHGDELVTLPDGKRVPYWWAERVAIAMEAGASESDARRVANEELKRRGVRRG